MGNLKKVVMFDSFLGIRNLNVAYDRKQKRKKIITKLSFDLFYKRKSLDIYEYVVIFSHCMIKTKKGMVFYIDNNIN